MISLDDATALVTGVGDAPRFSAEPVPYALIDELLRAAGGRLPARFDEPPWRFVVVVDRERELLVARLAEALGRLWNLGPIPPRGLASDEVLDAPALVLVFSSVPASEGLEALAMAGAAAQNATLLAHAAGLATHRIHAASLVPEVVLDFVGERLGPELRGGQLVTLLALGFPERGSEAAPAGRPARDATRWIGRADRPPSGASDPPPEVPKPAAVLRATRGERVLVADAYSFDRDRLAAQLAAAGYTVETFASGQRLLERATREVPDLYLLSESLRDTDGLELVRRIIEGGLRAPIVMTTARRDSAFRIAGLSAGVDYYLRKPVNPVELYSAARILLERRRLVAELQRTNQELGQLLAELRATQARLVQQAKMASLGQLVAGVAHDINTPLGAVVSNNDLFLRAFSRLAEALRARGLGDDPAFSRDLAAVGKLSTVTREACARITGLVRTLRTFARLDGAELQPADLCAGLESTLALVAHLAKPNTTIERRFAPLPKVECHVGQINQVFMNLLANACQAIEDAGTITITTVDEGDHVRVAISDTGRGISPEHRARLFDPGFTTKSTGVGLGLMISYQIVEAHGGEITVESELCKGATFTVRLPVKQPKSAG